MKHYVAALTIAGSDPSGGAGIQADIKTFTSLGVYALSAITAITVQNTQGVAASYPVSPEAVRAQIESIVKDVAPKVIKIGMVVNAPIIEAIADALKSMTAPAFIVLDPILCSSSGFVLLDAHGVKALEKHLVPLADLFTPNLAEAALLSGIDCIKDERETARAANYLKNFGAKNIIIKGGHSLGCPTDRLMLEDGSIRSFTGERIKSRNTHGTGCTFSSAVSAYVALGFPLTEAVAKAKDYTSKALLQGSDIMLGNGSGPLNHFFNPKHYICEEN